MKLNFTYEDWLNFKIVISGHGGKIVYSKDDKFSMVQLHELEESERIKIQIKQKEVFEKKRDELLGKWKVEFTKRYANSSLKARLVTDTISDLEEILFNKNLLQYRHDDYVVFELRNQHYEFTAEGLFTIQSYVQNIIKGGRDRVYDFIHAPNCPYQEKNITAPWQVYAQVAFDYVIWLKDNYSITGFPEAEIEEPHRKLGYEIPKSYFYWSYSSEKFKQFEGLLLKYEFIERNDRFEDIFKEYKVRSSNELIKFLKSRPEAFYLLYKINKNNLFPNGIPLHKVASNLFSFADRSDNSNVLNVSWDKFQKQMAKPDNLKQPYIRKWFKKADLLLSELSL